MKKNDEILYPESPGQKEFPQAPHRSLCLAKNLKATDITAMALAMDNDMTMVCFGLDEENSIVRVVSGEKVGTTVKNNF